jgi:predicted phage terminase large subunit-like protein
MYEQRVETLDLEFKTLLAQLDKLPLSQKKLIFSDLDRREKMLEKEIAQKTFMGFVKQVWPEFISGSHHARMASAFEKVVNGDCKRLIINMPPRHTKSEFASYLLPAWYLGKFPNKKVIQSSNTGELAVGFGRKVRNLVDSDKYKDIFPDLHLQQDSKAAGRWNTSRGGDYFAIGVGGTVTGKGADLLIIDDPHSEQEAALAAMNPDVFDKVYEWYTSGPRQRLQPNGSIVIVMTRWAMRDLTGQVLKAAAARGGEQWQVIEFPAILPSGNPVWPQFWKVEELEALRQELPNAKWQAQYQQNPIGNESAIIKRDWWQWWEKETPPDCEYVLQTWDTAFEKNQRADYSAGTTWGIFYNDEDHSLPNIVLLNTYKKRVEWIDLKRDVFAQYEEFTPDGVLIEKKATGAPLIYELRAMGIPVQEYTPSRGQDKIARLNSVSDIIASGKVWLPRTQWAEELVDEIAAFPSGEHDDLVDATTLALMRFRQGGFLRLPSDQKDEPKLFRRKGAAFY